MVVNWLNWMPVVHFIHGLHPDIDLALEVMGMPTSVLYEQKANQLDQSSWILELQWEYWNIVRDRAEDFLINALIQHDNPEFVSIYRADHLCCDLNGSNSCEAFGTWLDQMVVLYSDVRLDLVKDEPEIPTYWKFVSDTRFILSWPRWLTAHHNIFDE